MNYSLQAIIIAGFLVNTLISLYGMVQDKAAFSLNQVFWIFCSLFMGLAPLLQFIAGVSPWGRPVAAGTFIMVNTLLTASLAAYTWLRYYLERRLVPELAPAPVWPVAFIDRYHRRGSVVFIVCCLLLAGLSGKGLFLRSAAGPGIISDSALQLLADKILRGAVLYFALLSVLLFRQRKISSGQLLWVLLLALVSNFPLAVARYWAATFYIALLLCWFRDLLLRKKYLFRWLLWAAILLVYPLMSIARYSLAEIQQRFHSIGDMFRLSFAYGDFDAYTSLCTTVAYVDRAGITWGRQLATVLLFFVPRSWWPGKGVGSGALVNRLPGSDFTNFCSPVFAEGYINFGVAGCLLFTLALAWAITRYDRYYRSAQQSAYATVFYPAAIGMLFFMLRGDLLSSVAYTTGIYVSGWAFHRLLGGGSR